MRHQAAILRRLAATRGRARLPNDLDPEKVAEEVESAGRSEPTAVRSRLTVMLVPLVEAVSSPESDPMRLSLGEVTRARGDAVAAYTPAMHQHLDREMVRRRSRKNAAAAAAAAPRARMARRWRRCRTPALSRWTSCSTAKLAAQGSAATPS